MQLRIVTLAVLLCSLTVFIGCSTIIHPIDGTQIKSEGNWVCFSPEYLNEVMHVKWEKNK